jgi:hypothetical protein
MKRITYRNLEPQARFQLDDQWWVKVDGVTAKHASYDISIDMSPSCRVLISGAEQVPSSCKDGSLKQMRKREGLLLALGTFLESFHWLG